MPVHKNFSFKWKNIGHIAEAVFAHQRVLHNYQWLYDRFFLDHCSWTFILHRTVFISNKFITDWNGSEQVCSKFLLARFWIHNQAPGQFQQETLHYQQELWFTRSKCLQEKKIPNLPTSWKMGSHCSLVPMASDRAITLPFLSTLRYLS